MSLKRQDQFKIFEAEEVYFYLFSEGITQVLITFFCQYISSLTHTSQAAPKVE